MILHGISIADPANKNISHNIQTLRLDEEKRETQNKSMPHFVVSDQDQHNNFNYFEYQSVKGFVTEKEDTVPITTTLERSIDDKHYTFENEKKADVEKSVLETGKVLTDMNGQGYFDPGIHEKTSESQFAPGNHVLASTQKFSRPLTTSPTLLTNPQTYANEKNYLYKRTSKSFQAGYYANNPWKDAVSGRVSLFEQPREATRLA